MRINERSTANGIQVVRCNDSAVEGGQCHRREAERGVYLTPLLCKTISKRNHCLYTEILGGTMETKLARISQLSSENPDMVFTTIGHLVDKEMLKDCHRKMDGYAP